MKSLMEMLLLATRDRGCSVRFEWNKSTCAMSMKIKAGDYEHDQHILIENLRFTESVVATALDNASFGVMQAKLAEPAKED